MKSKFLNLNGVKTHIVLFGSEKIPSDPGVESKTLIMLHGWNGSHESFLELGKQLSESLNCQIIIPDLPGFGESDLPPATGWTTHDYELWLENLIKQYGLSQENIHFYGHSFGSRVICRYLFKHQNFRGKVILTGAAGVKLPPTLRERTIKIIKTCFGWGTKIIPPLARLRHGKITNFVLAKVFKAHDWANVNPALKETLRKVLAEPDFREELKTIRTQILLIWGKHDTYTPIKSAEIFHSHLKNSQLKLIETGRHGIHRTNPGLITAFVTEYWEQ